MKKEFILMVLVIILCVSCEKVTDITLNKSELLLIPNETEILIATIHPDDASNKKVTWKSDNPTVATVNDKGVVTAIADGETIITATSKNGKKTATCRIVVDYRNKWVGTYECEEIYSWSLGPTGHPNSSSGEIVFQTNVDVTVIGDSALKITESRGGNSYEVKIDVIGNFIEEIHWRKYISGTFHTDSLYFTIKANSSAGFSKSDYKGKKQLASG